MSIRIEVVFHIYRCSQMIRWFNKLTSMRRSRTRIISRFDSIFRPLHYAKVITDKRYAGILMDLSQPRFLTAAELELADVLFCAFSEKGLVHRIISHGSSGDYVHVAIYTGAGKVTEAVQQGVVEETLENFVTRYPYIAVCRCPGTKINGVPDLSNKVIGFCKQHAEIMTPYSAWGAFKAPLLELRELRNPRYWTKPPSSIPVKKRAGRTFFCSEFVIEAFIYGGYIDRGHMNSSRYSPSALAEECVFNLVGYLGSSELATHIFTHDYYLTGGISRE